MFTTLVKIIKNLITPITFINCVFTRSKFSEKRSQKQITGWGEAAIGENRVFEGLRVRACVYER
jgi:hypothetical protein